MTIMNFYGFNRAYLVSVFVLCLMGCQGPTTSEVAQLSRGKEIFDLWCSACHGPEGQGKRGSGAPAIAGLPEWYLDAQLNGFQSGFRGKHEEDPTGQTMQRMSLVALTEEGDLPSVAKYVASLKRRFPESTISGNPELGKNSYKACANCHGIDGRGDERLRAPPIVQLNDWYLMQELENFKIGARGVHPEDIWGALMRGNAVGLDSEAAKNVVAYIQTLREGTASDSVVIQLPDDLGI